jgi:hypothetical protein
MLSTAQTQAQTFTPPSSAKPNKIKAFLLSRGLLYVCFTVVCIAMSVILTLSIAAYGLIISLGLMGMVALLWEVYATRVQLKRLLEAQQFSSGIQIRNLERQSMLLQKQLELSQGVYKTMTDHNLE